MYSVTVSKIDHDSVSTSLDLKWTCSVLTPFNKVTHLAPAQQGSGSLHRGFTQSTALTCTLSLLLSCPTNMNVYPIKKTS